MNDSYVGREWGGSVVRYRHHDGRVGVFRIFCKKVSGTIRVGHFGKCEVPGTFLVGIFFNREVLCMHLIILRNKTGKSLCINDTYIHNILIFS